MAVSSAAEPRLAEARPDNPAYQGYWILRVGFTVAPILFGLDKFFHVLVNWDLYLAPQVDRILPGSANAAMRVVGVIEIVAGLTVAVIPRIGGYLVAAWLATIIANLLIKRDYYDIALRDFGLLLAALTLARLATAFRGPRGLPEHRVAAPDRSQAPQRQPEPPRQEPPQRESAHERTESQWEEHMRRLRSR